MASSIIHGREGALYLSTAGTSDLGNEVGYTNSWNVSMSRDLAEVTPLNSNSYEYVEGLISGTVSAEGSFRVGDTAGLNNIINRFAQMQDSSTAVTAIRDGDLYMHLIVKPIDTAGDTSNVRGAKFIAPILSNGFSVDASGTDIISWSYEGTVNGDLTYYSSTDTAELPKKIY